MVLEDCIGDLVEIFAPIQSVSDKLNVSSIQTGLFGERWTRVQVKFGFILGIVRVSDELPPLLSKRQLSFDEIRHVWRQGCQYYF